MAIVVAVSLGLTASPALAASASARPRIGPIQTLAHVPYPGNPGAVAIDGDTMWVDTSSANFDRPFDGNSAVFAYDLRRGQLLSRKPNPIVVPKLPVAVMGLAGIALDASGRMYIADMNGQVLRIDPRKGAVTTYARIPTSTSTSVTSMPGWDAFGSDGSLYVGDASTPTIWRIRRGGGEAEAWFADPRLGGGYGANVDGVAIDPSGRDLYFAAGNQPHISVYRLPLSRPDAAHLQLFHSYSDVTVSPCADGVAAADPNATLALANCAAGNGFGAGGIAFGKSGRLYVALFTKNELSILSPRGDELLRFPDRQQNMQLSNPVNGPFNVALDNFGRLLIADVGDPTFGYGPGHSPPPGGVPDSKSWAVLAVQVRDTPARLFRPSLP